MCGYGSVQRDMMVPGDEGADGAAAGWSDVTSRVLLMKRADKFWTSWS